MPYVVLGLGMLVSIIGAYAMYSGFRIIEIERGWATAIVGSVLFAGGLVTMAIGLALRALERLKAPLGTRPAAVAESQETAAQSTAAAPAIPERFEQPSQAAALAAGGAPLVSTLADALEEETAPPAPAKPRRILAESLPRDPQDPVPPGTDDEFFAEATRHRDLAAPADNDPLPLADEPPVFAASEPDEPEAPRHQHDEVASIQDPAKDTAMDRAMDSWLDESFADLDEKAPSAHDAAARTEPEASRVDAAGSDVGLASAPTEVYADAATSGARVDEPALAEAPSPGGPDQGAAPTPAVIGRYESEGTSYVMYADGSIEAQSDAGVYRFASMAELKAFIES